MEEYGEITKIILAYFADLHAGICPFCQIPIEEEKQVGGCVYAKPCGHRLFQGTAKKKENQNVPNTTTEPQTNL